MKKEKNHLTTGEIGKKIYRKIRNHSTAFAIIFFVLASFITIVVWSAFVTGSFYYIMESKISGEYKFIAYAAQIYEDGERDPEIRERLIDRDYLILNSKGDAIETSGEDTRVGEVLSKPIIRVAFNDGDVRHKEPLQFYCDANANFFTKDKDGDMEFSSGDFLKWITKAEELGFVKEAADGSETIAIPIWVVVPLKNSNNLFCGKGVIEISVSDAIFIAIFNVAILFAAVVILVIMFVNAISSIVTQSRMNNIFFMDMTTKGHNWMWFIIRGEQTLLRRKYRRSNFAVLDLVFVKYRNFCVCHSVEQGEKMLCKVNDTVSDMLTKGEVISHYASANFALLMQYKTKEEFEQRIREIIGKLEQMDSSHKFAFQVGIDYLNLPQKGRIRAIDLEKEYNNACAARATLSESDDSGVAVFDEDLVEEQRWIDLVQENQQSALDNEEFLVYYQPKYDPRTDELKGAEALIRWDSPKFGFKAPGSFIPIFEKNGFITKIDHYMLSHVAKDQKRWYDEGLPCVPVSVNFSRAHFIESDLAEQIRDMVDAAGAPRELIEIELTESAFFDDKKALVSTITKLREYGFLVSMDDFGSGYSSLNSLKDMPLDVLKLDAEFFRGDMENGRGEIVVSEAIKLAKSLNMQTVAEGVEVKEQVEFLARQGCDMIQGFYYAKPMPPEEYAERMRPEGTKKPAPTEEPSGPAE